MLSMIMIQLHRFISLIVLPPDSVTTIGDYAFYYCSNLTTVTISENSQLTTIGKSAFSSCTSLTSIFIPDSVTKIGSYAFSYCSNLTIYCEASSKPSGWDSYWNYSNRPVVWNSYLGVHDILNGLEYAVCIDNEGNPYIVITGYSGSNTDVVIPKYIEVNGEQIVVKGISNNAFEDNTKITSIYIPISVTSIGIFAFYNCSNLTIYCEASSKPSGWDSNWRPNCPVVWNCISSFEISDEGLHFVVVLDGNGDKYITITGYNGSSTNVAIPSSINVDGEDIPVKVIADNAFYNNKTITSVIIPNSVTTIEDNAFYKCSNLTTVTFGENSQLTTIGWYAFRYCSSLTSIYIPDSVTTIGSGAFYECFNLTIYCEASSKPSGWYSDWTYSNCPVVRNCISSFEISDEGLHFVVVLDGNGDKYITIGGYTGLSTNVVIPSSINVDGEDIPVKVITDNVFYNNKTITSVIIPDSVTTIGEDAFRDCSNLTTVTISENSQLISIGSSAFEGCSSLTSIYIPDSVTTIGSHAFYECSNLIIYCEAFSGPSGWDSNWYPYNRPVVWNCTYDEYLETIA